MEDEIDDKVLYQTYVSHMKLMSRFAWSVPLNINISPISFLVYLWRITKMYVLKPEILIVGTILVVLLMYLQAVDLWSHALLGRIQHTISRTARANVHRLATFNSGDSKKPSWHSKSGPIAAFAVQGRRPKMEDRFVINENVNNTGVRLLAIFDGHGGEFAANYAKDKLVPNLYQKIVAIKNICSGKTPLDDINCNQTNDNKPKSPNLHERKKIQKISSTDECVKGSKGITDLELLSKLDNLTRPITREVRSSQVAIIKHIPVCSYIDPRGKINYGKLLTDEVLVADQMLLEVAKKNLDVAGTTALIAVLEESKLFVANVGDSRGVMCDNRGNAIPLSFDHKPHQMRERKRIKEAGGFVTFNGVWRVAGILATSRALGDYPLKDKKFVIADPDILTFDLEDHKPLFIILASDGLWDTFTNEEAVAFIRERLNESDFGAKSITLEAYYRGSLDNITVVVINFQNFDFNLTDTS